MLPEGPGRTYLGSADLMERNLDRRVEAVFPVEDGSLAAHLRDLILPAYLRDTVNARQLQSDGTWTRVRPVPGEEPSAVHQPGTTPPCVPLDLRFSVHSVPESGAYEGMSSGLEQRPVEVQRKWPSSKGASLEDSGAWEHAPLGRAAHRQSGPLNSLGQAHGRPSPEGG